MHRPFFTMLLLSAALIPSPGNAAPEKGKTPGKKGSACECEGEWQLSWKGPYKKKQRRRHRPDVGNLAAAIRDGKLLPFLELTHKAVSLPGEGDRMQGGRLGLQYGGEHFFSVGYYRTPDLFDTNRTSGAAKAGFSYGGLTFGGLSVQDGITSGYGQFLLGTGKVTAVSSTDEEKTSGFLFVAEPELGLNVNVTSWLEIGLGGTWRYVSGLRLMGLKGGAFSGWGGTLHLRISDFD